MRQGDEVTYIKRGPTDCWPWVSDGPAPNAEKKMACVNPLCCNPRHIVRVAAAEGEADPVDFTPPPGGEEDANEATERAEEDTERAEIEQALRNRGIKFKKDEPISSLKVKLAGKPKVVIGGKQQPVP